MANIKLMKVSNEELPNRACMPPISEDITIRRWRWVSPILRRDGNDNTKIALTWALKVQGKEEGQKSTWRRNVEVERNRLEGNSWKTAENTARDHGKWQKLLSGLTHQLRCEEDK